MIEKLDKNQPIPLYYQVMQIIQRKIDDGQYMVGSYIPTEEQLQDEFDVSRSTIRKAILELVHQGYLERKRSKGTMVVGVKLEENLHELCSFTDQFLSTNIHLFTKILKFTTIACNRRIAKKLSLVEGESVHYMERLRMVDQVPVAFERWYAPESIFPGLSKAMFSETGFEQSTYYILYKKYGLKVVKALDSISPISLYNNEAQILHANEGVPALLRTRISFDSYGRPVNYGSGVYLIKINLVLESR